MMMMKRILLPRTIVRCTNYFSSTPSSSVVPPWLMFSSAKEDKIGWRYFYSFTEDEIVHESRFPEISGHRLIGSSQGYLLTVGHDGNLVATNPLRSGAGTRILLPPTSSLPDVKDCNHMAAEEKSDYVSLILRDTHAILSPGARAAVVVYEPRIGQSRLAFARAGDQNWTALNSSGARPWDMIFREGCLHTIHSSGEISIYDLDHPSDPPFVSSRAPPKKKFSRDWSYLVESPYGNNLFLVSESKEDNDWKNQTANTWKRMKKLGDVALFVGLNHSMSLYTPEFPGIKKNCIYYAHDDEEMGIYSLKDKDVKPIEIYSNEDSDQYDRRQPMWFMPAH